MKLHNKLEINYNGEKFIYYNTLLDTVIDEISSFKAYNNFIAIGSGTTDTTADMETLENQIMVLPSEVESYNFDISKGIAYITKKVQIDKGVSSSFTISEVAVSSDELGSKIINRFLLPSPITWSEGDSLLASITIYLAMDTGSSNMNVLSGENPLIALLLGYSNNAKAEEHSFSIAKGVSRTPTEAFISYESLPGEEIEATLQTKRIDGGVEFMLSAEIPGSDAVKEVVVAFDGVPCFRVSNFDVVNDVTTITETVTADSNMTLSLSNPYISEIVEVYNTTSDAVTLVGKEDYYGLELGNYNEAPFGSYEYKLDTTRFVSHNGRAIAFLVDGRLDFYIVQNGTFKKQDTTNFIIEGLQTLRMLDKMIIARYYDSNLDVHSTIFYYLKDGMFEVGQISIPWDNLEGERWTVFDLNECNSENTYIVCMVTSNNSYMGYLVFNEDEGRIYGTDYYALGKALDTMYVTSGSNMEDAYAAGYLSTGDETGAYIIRIDGYKVVTSTITKDLFYRCFESGTINAYNGYFFAGYNDSYYYTYKRFFFYCDSCGTSKVMSYNANYTKIYPSVDGNYIMCLRADEGNEVYYFTSDRKPIAFISEFPSKFPADQTDDVVFLKDVILLFRMSPLPTASIPIVTNYTKVSPVQAGHVAEVTYNTVVLPGADGSDVNVNIALRCTK